MAADRCARMEMERMGSAGVPDAEIMAGKERKMNDEEETVNENTRYRLQRKTKVARPNILGGHSFPVYAWQWRDIAACAEREPLEKEMARLKMVWQEDEFRVEDTRPQEVTL